MKLFGDKAEPGSDTVEPAQEATPMRTDPAAPIGEAAEFPPMAVALVGPPIVVRLEKTLPVRDDRPDRFSCWRVTLNAGVPARLANGQPSRRKLRISTALTDVFIGPNEAVTAEGPTAFPTGLLLDDIQTTAEMWGVSTTGGTVYLMAELESRIPDER